MSELQSGIKLPPTQLFVTANSQKGFISMDGRSEKSRFWAGGAAYVVMCVKCGLEPSRQGSVSNCFCMCDACAAPLNGRGSVRTSSDVNPGKAQIVCQRCGGQGNSVVPICTREVRAKRSRDSYTPWHKKPTTVPSLQTPSSGAAIATVAITDNAVQGAAAVEPVETSKVLAADHQSVEQKEISIINLRSVTRVADDNHEDRETNTRGENTEDNHAEATKSSSFSACAGSLGTSSGSDVPISTRS